ncbi:MAG: 5-formyltetrahydrofolate cyclo-ligase, partial [Acetobacteraceae bacterium]|nr:5-formyltetrahydrofolate cyclo-ligase [Acetobacteraceae bacterium]
MTDALLAAKAALRVRMREVRASCDPRLAADLVRHILHTAAPPPGAVVAGFWPLPDEVDIRPLLGALHERGHVVVLPQTPRRGGTLMFRAWQPGAAMIAEPFGTFRPDGE